MVRLPTCDFWISVGQLSGRSAWAGETAFGYHEALRPVV